MVLPAILGFQSLLLVSLLAVCLLIRRNLKNAAEKKDEIMRLVAMASEETAMAELEYTAEYSPLPVSSPYHCAVCYCPTTTRCSQCKAVRYCSGKCQILHWRQGHKDECHPPTAPMHFDEGSDFGKQSVQVIDDDGKVKSCIDTTATTAIASSNTSSLRRRGEFCTDTSCRSVLGSSTAGRSKGPLYDGHIPASFGSTSACVNEMHQSKPPSLESTNLVHCVDGSHANKLKMKPSNHSNEEVSFGAEFSKGSKVTVKEVQLKELGDRKSNGRAALSRESVTNGLEFKSSEYLYCSRSDPADDDNEIDSHRREPDRIRSSSFGASRERTSSTSRGHNRSSSSAVKVDSCQAFPAKMDSTHSSVGASGDGLSSTTQEQTISSSNSAKVDSCQDLPRKMDRAPLLQQTTRDSLKTSVRKVVQQFRGSKQSKPHQLGLGNEIKRHDCKVLFPYEVFIKLYSSDNVELRPFGLINCGNSCYANAVLQCLSFTRPLTSYLLLGLHSKACRKKGWCFICEFECLLLQAREGKSPLSPIRILSKIEKIGSHLSQGTEEDAHEFLRYAVDTMQSSCLKEAGAVGSVAEETTLVGLTFGGYLRSKIKCMKCLGKSERYEPMMDLTVEIDGEISTLQEALGQFTATELLDGVNKYYCSRCKSYEKAKKKLTVWESPNILTIVLKRFQSDNFEKLNKSIRYPEVLNMAPYMSGTTDKYHMYSLYAVIVHLDIMNAAFSGHYVCYVKNLHGEWFKIDDCTVIPVELDRVLFEGAYMLLYARHSPQPRTPYLAKNNVACHSHSDQKLQKRNNNNRSNPRVSRSTDWKVGKYPSRMSLDNPAFDPNDWRLHSIQKIPRVDSSSENSSLFSCSDATSCSSVSTKDSASTGDFSDYIFG